MAIYYIILALSLLLGIPFLYYKPSKTKKIIYLALIFGIMWVLNTFRLDIGYDYTSYIDMFNTVKPLSLEQVLQHITGQNKIIGAPKEPAFTILSWIMGRFISSSIVMYGVYSLIIMAPIAWFIYKYSDNAWLSVWLYITMFFFFTNMSFVRQSIACSIALFGFDFFRKKKTIPFILIALLAASFQYSALILIPIYFATFIPINRYTVSAYFATVFIAFLASDFIVDFVTNYVYKSYKGSKYLVGRLGASYMVLPSVIIIAVIALYPVWRKRNNYASSLLIATVISSTFWLFASYKHMIIERLCMYTYIYALYTLPSAISALKASPKLTQRNMNWRLFQNLASLIFHNKISWKTLRTKFTTIFIITEVPLWYY